SITLAATSVEWIRRIKIQNN
ncbi:putative o-glucosyltransferase LpsA, partial [Vibrio parahaemolyticus VPTS-2010_2]